MSSLSLKQFQELVEEISKLGGDSLLREARLIAGKQDEVLVRALKIQLEQAIGEVPVKLE
jgi:hypothetical protein